MKLDLNTIKEGIDKIKAEKKEVSTKLGEGTNPVVKDEFLNELITSLQTGKETSSTQLIKMVENKISEKKGEEKKHSISETKIPRKTKAQVQNNNSEQHDREEQLFKDIESNRQKTLAESIGSFGDKTKAQPMPQQSTTVNGGYLKENVEKIVSGYITESFSSIVEETIKSTILEMYTIEKVKEALEENKDTIKKIVIETIRGLQSKKKTQS